MFKCSMKCNDSNFLYKKVASSLKMALEQCGLECREVGINMQILWISQDWNKKICKVLTNLNEGFFFGIFEDLISKVLFWKKFWTNI